MLINTILQQHIIFHSAHHSPPVPSGVTGGEDECSGGECDCSGGEGGGCELELELP